MRLRTLFLTLPSAAAVSCLAVAAQDGAKNPRILPVPLDVKAPRQPDPVKGWGEAAPLRAPAPEPSRKPHADGPVAQRVLAEGPVRGEVVHDTAADGTVWVSGASYKASFGAEGFTYFPWFGSDAPRNYPVRFTMQAVTVGGRDLAFAGAVLPERDGNRVVFQRGAVQEIYVVGPRGVEQTFVVDGTLPGDVVVELGVASELHEDAARPGLQFGNERGTVDYGTAFVVDGARKTEITSSFDGRSIRLHVPAAQRAAGAVVIDPVIRTGYTSMIPTQDFANPDIAFDASTDRYLLVWQHDFSAADVDVYGEMRTASGSVVAGSLKAIDNTTAHWSRPRVANLNAYDRFLVVAERFYPGQPSGQQCRVWGRTQDAASPFAQGAPFEISAATSGDKLEPDVGGDPNILPPTYWTVVYTREAGWNDCDIHGRQVEASGALRTPILIQNSANTVFRSPRISASNGALHHSRQRWMVVYSYRFSSTDWDVHGATLSWDGAIDQPSRAIDASPRSDVSPHVSSATHAVPGAPTFAVVYRTENTPYVMLAKVLNDSFANVVPLTNLTSLLGTDYVYFPRIETDGCRFALTYATQPAFAATLGVVGGALVVHEAPQLVGSHNAFGLEIASRGVAGGTNTGYGLTFTDVQATPDRIVFAAYDGHAAGGLAVRPTGCGGLGITGTGTPWLGRSVTATLTGTGTDGVGLMVGRPIGAVPLCLACFLGVDLGGPLINLPNLGTLQLPIPTIHAFVGSKIAVQGYAVGAGICFGVVRLSDTLDITIQ